LTTESLYYTLNQLSLETERLIIRPVIGADLQSVYEIHQLDEVNKYLPYTTWQNWDDAKDWFARVQHRRLERSSEQYVLERKRDKKVIGSCIVFNFNEEDHALELGYVLSRDAWGKGYMQEALYDVLVNLKRQAEIKFVKASVDDRNLPSITLLDRLDFKKTGSESEEDGSTLGIFQLSL